MITIHCLECGAAVVTSPSRATSKKYCSRRCQLKVWHRMAKARIGPKHHNWRPRAIVPCAYCGKGVTRYAGEQRNAFCSRACVAAFLRGPRHARWLGGTTHVRGPNWPEQRRAALTRDKGMCVRCGANAVHVHHVKPYCLFSSRIEANDLVNLISLCRRCHGQVEAEYWRANPTPRQAVPVPRDVKCKRCGRPFIPLKWRSPERYCPECRVMKPCEMCGAPIDVTARRQPPERVRFCSKQCLGRYVGLSSRGKSRRVPPRSREAIARMANSKRGVPWSAARRQKYLDKLKQDMTAALDAAVGKGDAP